MRSRFFVIPVLLASLAIGLGGCETISGWFSSNGRVSKLKGTRIPVLTNQSEVSRDSTIQNTPVVLPKPYTNKDWPSQGGYSSSAMYHLSAPGPLEKKWETDIGEGSDTDARIMAAPVVANGIIYALNAASEVYAINAKTGDEIWHKHVADPGYVDTINILTFGLFGKDKRIDTTKAFGGGLCVDNGKLFATDGVGDLVAFDAKTGQRLWSKNVGIPIYDSPVASGGRVFVSSQDNHFHAFSEEDGHELWDHQGISEPAGILVSTSASVSGDFVVVPYTSGELYALRVQNGRPAWSDMLTRTGNASALSSLDDIAARPVIDRDRVIAIGHSGVMAAIDIDSGERIWTRDIGGVQTPWVAGDYIYVLSGDHKLICLTRKEGRIKWITDLPKLTDPTDEDSDPAIWAGPVLVSNRLLLISNSGKMVSVSPYTGEMLGRIHIEGGSYISPVVADGMVYVITDDGYLDALK